MSLDFGDYCLIEQNRYGAENEMYLYKVIGTANCNYYVPVPTDPKNTKTHGPMAPCVKCICCGPVEENVETFRLEDVKPNTKFKTSSSINFNEDRIGPGGEA